MEPTNEVQPTKPMGVIGRIVNLFVSPAETFRSLALKPDWVTPLILTLLVYVGSGLLIKDIIQKEQEKAVRRAIAESTQIEESQKEQIADEQVTMMQKFWFVGVAIGGIVIAGLFFLGALFVRLAANRVLGSPASYLHVLAIFGYSRLIEIVAGLVKLPAMIRGKTLRVDTGLGYFVPHEEITSATYTFLSKFDLFTVWELIVLTIGVAILYRAPKGKSAMVVVGLWLLWALVQTGLATIGIRFA